MNDTIEKGQKVSVFDDVFKTICHKMPQLLIPVVNEAFGTNYDPKTPIRRLGTEQHEKYGKRNADSIFEIEGHYYHIENQSTEDGNMAVRMLEYDFSVALENLIGEDDLKELRFPASCVIYIRNGNIEKRKQKINIAFADGWSHEYMYEVLSVQMYSKDDIFKKDLLLFLPYYILRYEKTMPTSADKEKLQELADDMKDLVERLWNSTGEDEKRLCENILNLIEDVTNHIVKSEDVKRRLEADMRGRILELPSDRIEKAERKAEKRGYELAKKAFILEAYSEGRYTKEEAAAKLSLNTKEFDELLEDSKNSNNGEELDVM